MEGMDHIKTIHTTEEVREYYLEGEDIIVEVVHRSNNNTATYKKAVTKFIKEHPNHEILPILSCWWGVYQ